jgi:tRNA(adenine34) deaminase
MLTKDIVFMRAALAEAKKAFALNEVPVGAVIVKDDVIISGGHNSREYTQNALAHAELIAINAACKKLVSWRLLDCSLYVTLEPCPMCIGAAINARIENLIFGCAATESNRANTKRLDIKGGILELECAFLLSEFFAQKRVSPRREDF